MAVDTCFRGHTKDKGLPCNRCAAEAIAGASADRRPPDGPPDGLRRDGPPGGGAYLPTGQAGYEDLLLAACLAYEAAEFGASLNRAAAEAGADLDRGGRVEVAALHGLARWLAGSVRGVISRDRENGFGPGSGGMSGWEEEFEGYASVGPAPREARRGDGDRLRLLADRLGRLLQRVDADMDGHEALGRARRAAAEWPRLLPWAFGLCACGRKCDASPDARDATCAPCASRRLDEEARAAAEPECPRCGGGLWAPTNAGGALVCGACFAEFRGARRP